MPITIYLEIAIGIVFVWLFLALAVMALQEWVAAIFKTRAKGLQKILRGMLEDPKAFANVKAGATSIVDLIYKHPSVRSLQRPSPKRQQTAGKLSRLQRIWQAFKRPESPGDETSGPGLSKRLIEAAKKPTAQEDEALDPLTRGLTSYIPSRTFATTLFDVITTAGTDESVITNAIETWEGEARNLVASLRETGTLKPEVQDALEPFVSDIVALAKTATSQSELANTLGAKLQVLRKKYPYGVAVLDPIIDELPQYLLSKQVVQGIAKLTAGNPGMAQVLNDLKDKASNLVAEGENMIAAYRIAAETWFDDTMARAEGWWKRGAQRFAFVSGLIVAILFNIDSLTVVTTLYREPTVRSTLVAQAEALERIPETDVSSDLEAGQLPKELTKLDTRLQDLGLPVGWHGLDRAQCTAIQASDTEAALKIFGQCFLPGEMPHGIPATDGEFNKFGFWFRKGAGWLLSGAMAAQGAPFWFDILKKLVNVRSAGKKPEESEGKKDGKKSGPESDGSS